MSNEIQTVEAEVVTATTTINDSLVKANITEAVISGLKEKYLPMTINGQEDREGYMAVKEARKDCKAWRVRAEKVCKKGREDAVAVQKAWVAKEKDVSGRIGEVEDYLQKLEDDYDAEKERIKQEIKAKHDAQYTVRSLELAKLGASFDGANFVSGDVSYESSLIREADDDLYNTVILPKYQEVFNVVEAASIEANRVKAEQDAERIRQQEELQKQQRELSEKQAAFEKQQKEADQKRLDDEAKKIREELSRRATQLTNLGMSFNFQHDAYIFEDVNVDNKTEICLLDAKEWDALIEKITHVIKERKDAEAKRAEEKRLKDIKDAEEAAAKKERERIEEEQRKAELLRQQKEQQRIEEEAKASDKEKWAVFLSAVNDIKVPAMKSGVYKKKISMANEKLGEINGL